jgi:hypothetical protein
VTVLIAEPIWGNKEILKKEPSNAATLSEKINKTENPGTKMKCRLRNQLQTACPKKKVHGMKSHALFRIIKLVLNI